jgi:hypothetical protein
MAMAMKKEELEAIKRRVERGEKVGEFIAAARSDVPQLVAEVERLRALISELEPYATERVFEIGGDDMAGRLSKRIREALGEE